MMIISIPLAATLIFGPIAHAGELSYFSSKIDYWGDSKAAPEAQKIDAPRADEKTAFPWKVFKDPKNKEFFKEGDYTPPEPFMEIARNPTDENIREWFQYIQKKNEVAARLNARMQEYLAKNGGGEPMLPPMVAQARENPGKATASAPLDPNRFRLRMYFDSNCPHCRRMFGILKRLQSEGYAVEALQIDNGPVPEEERVVPIGKATPAELKAHKIQGVPFLLIADTKKKALLPPVEGFHEYSEVLALLKEANRL